MKYIFYIKDVEIVYFLVDKNIFTYPLHFKLRDIADSIIEIDDNKLTYLKYQTNDYNRYDSEDGITMLFLRGDYIGEWPYNE